MSDSYTGEQLLTLSDGRTLSYEANGVSSSSLVVIFFHGVFSVGTAKNLGPYLRSRGVHYIAPTVQGWGNSSPIPDHTSHARQFAIDMAELLEHLHPNDPKLQLYVSGGSYGTVYAQFLYGAPYDIFPFGRYLKGCLLLASFSPLRYHPEALKAMTWGNYIMVGPPGRVIPFKLLQRMARLALKGKLATIEGSEAFVRETIFDKMDDAEKEEFRAWSQKMGKEEGQFEKEMALGIHKSTMKTWKGFFTVPDVFASDWGYDPGAIDAEHSRCKVILMSAKGDDMAPIQMARWLAQKYPNSRLIEVEGGHISGVYHLEDAWMELIDA